MKFRLSEKAKALMRQPVGEPLVVGGMVGGWLGDGVVGWEKMVAYIIYGLENIFVYIYIHIQYILYDTYGCYRNMVLWCVDLMHCFAMLHGA